MADRRESGVKRRKDLYKNEELRIEIIWLLL